MKLSCLCARVSIELEKRAEYIHECNCTWCSKTGARWAYFHPSEVGVEGKTTSFTRQDKSDPSAEVHFCSSCGSTTHFVLTETAVAKFGNSLMGVNMWLADPQDLAGLELRFPDGRSWPGEGDFSYLRETRLIGPIETS